MCLITMYCFRPLLESCVICNTIPYYLSKGNHITFLKSEKFWTPFHLAPSILEKGLWTIYIWILKDFLYPFNTLCFSAKETVMNTWLSSPEEVTAERTASPRLAS